MYAVITLYEGYDLGSMNEDVILFDTEEEAEMFAQELKASGEWEIIRVRPVMTRAAFDERNKVK